MEIKKNKKPMLLIAIVLLIAGLADLKYRGKFYQLLPSSVQSTLDDLLE